MSTSTKTHHSSIAAWTFGVALLLFFLLVFLFAPPSLPEFKQKMLGLIAALLSGFLAFFLTGNIGVKWVSEKSPLGRVAVKATGALGVFCLVLWWWWFSHSPPVAVEQTLQKTTEIERYTKGAAYPRISVEPYFGPSEGIRRTLSTTPEKPGFLGVFIENTNDFPIFDLEIVMVDVTPQGRDPQTMETFNAVIGRKMHDLQILHPNKMISELLPANPGCQKLGFDFNAKSRSADTSHEFRFVVVSNRWEAAQRVVEVKTGKILANNITQNYPRNAMGGALW